MNSQHFLPVISPGAAIKRVAPEGSASLEFHSRLAELPPP
uniref:Uncharacterized protein n=1 Tax=Magnetospirillum gryphiswaldense TaxID=55518 RepID=A4U3E7_9PROT|nr:hypothetical protein MGR_2921 [Magnetospirillum gryphiswaldense MSR-1]